jgi:transcription initiation factor TFIID subunit 2
MPGVLLDMDSQDAPPPKAPEHGFVVSHQTVFLDIDFSTQSLTGRSEIIILPQNKDLRTIKIDARQCVIQANTVKVNEKVADFAYEDPMKLLEIPKQYDWDVGHFDLQKDRLKPLTENATGGSLVITIPKGIKVEETDQFSENATGIATPRASVAPFRAGSIAIDGAIPFSANSIQTPKTAADQGLRFQPMTVSIPFAIKKFRDGLHFVGCSESDQRYPHVYTKHSMDPGTASCIFPCVDDPTMRCTWDIKITCSRTLGDAFKRRQTVRPHPKGLHHLLSKKGLANAIVHTVAPVEDNEIWLSDEEKLLDMTAVCSGDLESETTDLEDSSKKTVSFSCQRIVAAKHIGFAIGPFEQVDLSEFREDEDDEKLGQGQTLPVLGYCLPGRSDEVRHTCTPMAHALDHFLLTYGAYPFNECRFVFVDDQIRDVEHTASLSLCSNRLLFSEKIIDPEYENTRTLVHAIASQWFGVSIVPAEKADRWTTFGLSHFVTNLFMKNLCGNNEYSFRQKVLSDRLVELDIERPSLHALGETLHLGPFELEFMTLKAPLVLFILDKRIIKASGTSGLARVISRMVMASNTGTAAESVVSTENFRRSCEKTTKYRQTEPFWNQWILGAGCPRFSISQKFNKKRLCVEMQIRQTQENLPSQRNLSKESFMREFKEDVHGIYAGELQTVFTGPMTIRIHEADGTPYEHVVEIREGVQKIDIPYNTKYKRLKRSRRQRERLNAGPVDPNAEASEDALYYCLGDVLQSPAEIQEWGLRDWDQETEAKMDQESYEWVRIDADFEWICDKSFISMPAYMYVSQLQQDRDVVAQQESMLYLKNSVTHPLVSTFLIRTLMDTRYFHGIRAMAAEQLKSHATEPCNWAGFNQLKKAYRELFCYPDSNMPQPNDFSDKRAYKIEMAIARGLSQIRDLEGPARRCTKEARQMLLDMLRFNDNSSNEYADYFKIANLLNCLTESLIPGANKGEDEEDRELIEYRENVFSELDRYRNMDEWANSYQNFLTVTALDCKHRLMKAKVMPVDPLQFARYLHDGTSDFVRIKAFECLIRLGYMTTTSVAALLLSVMSTDSSPYTREHLFEIFCLGLATIAFGDDKPFDPVPPRAVQNGQVEEEVHGDVVMGGGDLNGADDMAVDGEAGGLIVEQDVSLEARKAQIARSTTIEGALAALRNELKDDKSLAQALWKAIRSDIIEVHEQADLLDICYVLYDIENTWIMKLQYPFYWEVHHLGKVCFVCIDSRFQVLTISGHFVFQEIFE